MVRSELDESLIRPSGVARLVWLRPGSLPGDVSLLRRCLPEVWLAPACPTEGPPPRLSALREVMGPHPLAVVVVDAEGALRWANAAGEALLGPTLPTHLAERIAPSQGYEAPDLGNRLKVGDRSVPVQVEAWPVRDDDRPGDGLLALSIRPVEAEVWQRETLGRARQWQAQRLRDEQAVVLILNAQGAILDQGPALNQLRGKAFGEGTGELLALPFAEDRARFQRALEEACAAPGRTVAVRLRVLDAAGATRWLEGGLTNQLDHPLVRGLWLEARDTTEQRLLQDTLRRQDRLRLASLLGATLAHDINHLASQVMAGLERQGAELEPERRALQQLTSLCQRLLGLEDRDQAEARRVDLGRCLRELEPLLHPLLRDEQRLVLVVDPGEHPVRVHRGALDQALINLVLNARDAMGPTGTVQVSARRRSTTGRAEVLLGVEDDGAGMPAEVRERLLQPGFTTKRRGSGLGMVVVNAFAQEHEASLEVESEPGRGCRIALGLPIDCAPVAAMARPL